EWPSPSKPPPDPSPRASDALRCGCNHYLSPLPAPLAHFPPPDRPATGAQSPAPPAHPHPYQPEKSAALKSARLLRPTPRSAGESTPPRHPPPLLPAAAMLHTHQCGKSSPDYSDLPIFAKNSTAKRCIYSAIAAAAQSPPAASDR